MFTVGPTFFSRPVGDHPEGDGLTRLQTTFAGASADDISGFAVPATVTGGTLGEGYYDVTIPINTASILGVSYSSTDVARQAAGQALTVEVFLALQTYPVLRNSSTQTHVFLSNLTSNMQGGNYPIQVQTTGGYTQTNLTQVGIGYANWSASGPCCGFLVSARLPHPHHSARQPQPASVLDGPDHALHRPARAPRIHVLWRHHHPTHIPSGLGATMKTQKEAHG